MKVREITTKTLLAAVKQPDTWFGLKYNMNLYRGCQHRCIYCDSRSKCYGIEGFDSEILVKANAIDLLDRELSRKRVKGTIGTGSMNDPYMPLEKQVNLTGRALEVIARHRFPVHVLTKSSLVLKDLDTLVEISQVYAAVSFTITTADDALARRVEPGAPPPSARLAAMQALGESGILTGALLMPVLPLIEDTEANILEIVRQVEAHGGRYVLAAFGMTCREGQREYYYDRLDQEFPGVRDAHHRMYGVNYYCPARNAAKLEASFQVACSNAGLLTRMPVYQAHQPEQMRFL